MRTSSDRPSAPTHTETVLVVQVGDARHALALADVREVVPVASIVPVPRAPRVVAGVLSVRGAITTVVDLRGVLGLGGTARTEGPVVLVELGGEVVGLWVDRVLRVETRSSEGEPVPNVLDLGDVVSSLAAPAR